MKIQRIVFSLILFALISVINTNAQIKNPMDIVEMNKPDLKTDVVGSYPTEVWEYTWNVEMWSVYQQKRISYTSFGQPSEITIIGEDGDRKTTFTYNADQLVVERLEQKKSAGEWVNDRREKTEYGLFDSMTSHMVESWIGGEWVLLVGSQYTYEMQGEKMVFMESRIWDRASDGWINESRMYVSYNDDMTLIETTTMTWEDGQWKNIAFAKQTLVDGRVTEIVMSGWVDEAWAESTKMIYEYGENDSNVMTIFTGTTDAWTPSQKFTSSFDTHGNQTLSKVEIYALDWMVLSGSEYILTYDGNNLVERITKTTGLVNPGVWKNSYKEEFKAFASLSTNPLETDIESISHYPNPAGDYVSLNIENLGNKFLDISVLDLTGKILKTDNMFVPVSNYKYILDLNDLAPGVLIIQAREKSGKLVQSMRVIHQD